MGPSYRRNRFGLFPLLFIAALLFITFLVHWLWNNVLVVVAPVKTVTYWQAMGLLVLCRILFGGFRFGSPGQKNFPDGRQAWREKWGRMSRDERTRFRDEWRRRCQDRT